MTRITAEQCMAARILLGWERGHLAKRSNVGLTTIGDYERGDVSPLRETAHRIHEAFRHEGLRFPKNGVLGIQNLPACTATTVAGVHGWYMAIMGYPTEENPFAQAPESQEWLEHYARAKESLDHSGDEVSPLENS